MLTDTHHLRVEYTVAEEYLAALKTGQTVKLVTFPYPDQEFSGQLSYIAPTVNTQDRTISVYADVPNDDQRLRAGLFVTVTHSLGVMDNVLLMSATSLMSTMDGHEVYKLVDGKAVIVPVEIGQRTADSVQVLKG